MPATSASLHALGSSQAASQGPRRVLIEVLVDSVASARGAQEGGADRLEVCQNLFEGGTTPNAGLLTILQRIIEIPYCVMIRPRGGDFCYSPDEFAVMQEDIRVAKNLGAYGVVFGLLTPDGRVDRDRTRQLIELAHPMSVTFHRAFDMTRDPLEALEELITLGVHRILSSGQEASVFEGVERLSDWMKRAGDRIIVMPGGGIREHTVERIVRETGAREIHVSGSGTVQSAMEYRNNRVFMGKELRAPEYSWSVVDPNRIQTYRRLVG